HPPPGGAQGGPLTRAGNRAGTPLALAPVFASGGEGRNPARDLAPIGHPRAIPSPNAARPAKGAAGPSCSSIRRRRLYLARRSERATEPILIWPAAVATARSAIVVSS